MSEVLIEGVAKRFGRTEVIHGIDLTIKKGELTVLLGPSGCGKSTLLRMIAGLEDISEGVIRIDGEEVNDLEPVERGCAMVFQNYALYPHQTVRKNMAFPLKMARLPKAEIERRVAATAKLLQLEELLDRLPRDLSGGQRQRVAMGRAMIREPRIFLFDEPLSNLDAELRVRMRLEISRLQSELEATMVFVTHDQVEAMTLAHRIVIMRAGLIEQVGTPLEVYRRPANRFVAGFIGSPSMNFIDVKEVRADATGSQLTFADGSTLVAGALPPETASVGIRPEHIRIGAAERASLSFPAGQHRSIGAEHLGDRSYRYLSLPFGELTMLAPEEQVIDEAAPLALSFDPARLHCFASDGRRLERAAA